MVDAALRHHLHLLRNDISGIATVSASNKWFPSLVVVKGMFVGAVAIPDNKIAKKYMDDGVRIHIIWRVTAATNKKTEDTFGRASHLMRADPRNKLDQDTVR